MKHTFFINVSRPLCPLLSLPFLHYFLPVFLPPCIRPVSFFYFLPSLGAQTKSIWTVQQFLSTDKSITQLYFQCCFYRQGPSEPSYEDCSVL